LEGSGCLISPLGALAAHELLTQEQQPSVRGDGWVWSLAEPEADEDVKTSRIAG
jgi:hypothetical protein